MHEPLPDPPDPVSTVAELLADARIPPVGRGAPVQARFASLQSLRPDQLSQRGAVRDLQMAGCCLAGLWLRFDFLDESHRWGQAIETPAGSYWHGIMHRREGDFGNAKYWFRRAGRHSIHSDLSDQMRAGRSEWGLVGAHDSLAGDSSAPWDPMRFVDACESAVAEGNRALEAQCQTIAWWEWQLLFKHCWQHAFAQDA